MSFTEAYLKTKKMNCYRCGGIVDAWKYSVNGGLCDKCKGEVVSGKKGGGWWWLKKKENSLKK